MLRMEGHTPHPGTQMPPAIVNAADASAAPNNRVEQRRITPYHLFGECILSLLQGALDGCRPLLGSPFGMNGQVKRFAESQERLGRSLVPEGQLDRQRDDQSAIEATRQMSDA